MSGIRHEAESEPHAVILPHRASLDSFGIVDCVAPLNDCVAGLFQPVPEPYPMGIADNFHIGDLRKTECDSASFAPDQLGASPGYEA